MTTNKSIDRLAADLLRQHPIGYSFEVILEPTDDLERVAIRLQQLGCHIQRHPRFESVTVSREDDGAV